LNSISCKGCSHVDQDGVTDGHNIAVIGIYDQSTIRGAGTSPKVNVDTFFEHQDERSGVLVESSSFIAWNLLKVSHGVLLQRDVRDVRAVKFEQENAL
jgi:hypothetical protein